MTIGSFLCIDGYEIILLNQDSKFMSLAQTSSQPKQPLRASHVSVLLLVFAGVWLWHLSSASLTAPQDNLEQLLWTHSLQWGYYKHPPLPTWLLWPWLTLFGWHAWVSYLWGAFVSLLAFVLFWRLLADLRGRQYAFLALLAALCITYYNGRLYYYNHNTVLMLFVCLSAWASWQAMQTQRRKWWVVLGLALGAGALSKYQIAISVLCVLVFFIQQGAWRIAAQRQGLVIAGAVSMLVFAPHAFWLQANEFAPLAYARESSLGVSLSGGKRVIHSMRWLVDMLLNRALPAWLLLVIVASLAAKLGEEKASTESESNKVKARAFLLIWGAVPLLFIVFLGLVTGAELAPHWGTAFLLFAIPAAMELWPKLWPRAQIKYALATFVMLQALLLLASYLTSYKGPANLRDKHWRSIDSARLASQIEPKAQEILGRPARVLIGSANISMAIAMQLPGKPLVLVDGRFDRSPWIPADLVERCGAIEIIKGVPVNPPPEVQVFGKAYPGWGWKIVRPTRPDASC
ncbi:MAG: glycosyl transferase [Burkholderiales bacterium]|nr:MAG: glycosyl transferase [Burkholderiales bacterium]